MTAVYYGFIVAPESFSDDLMAGQVDAFSMNLIAGQTYYLDIANATTPLDIALAGPGGILHSVVGEPAGYTLIYTAPLTGQYGLGIDTEFGNAGSYKFIATAGAPAVPLATPAPTPSPLNSTAGSTLTFGDVTQGTTTNQALNPYTGPVAGLTSEMIYAGADSVNMLTTAPNVFLRSGSGQDALQVVSGNNVLDGGTGSNFLYGGSGNDTFFLDDRGSVGDLWSTVVGFHAGDAVTVWGISQSGFVFNETDNGGASGYTGLTITAAGTGHPNATLTLTGYATADLNNGRLAVSFGHDIASGSDYAYIQAR